MSVDEPKHVPLSDGSYLQFDCKEGTYRVAFYQRRVGRSVDLQTAIGIAMKKPIHDRRVQEVSKYLAKVSS